MRNKILWKLSGFFTIILLLFSIILGTTFLSIFRKNTIDINRNSMEEQAVSIASSVAEFQNQNIGMHGRMQFGAYLRFLNNLSMADVWVVDENLEFITGKHNNTPIFNELPKNASEIVKRVFEGEKTFTQDFSSLLGTPTLTVGAPIFINNNVIGAVLLHSPISGIDQSINNGMKTLGIGTILALILSITAAIGLSYLITKPLKKINDTTLTLVSGDYSVKTGINQKDEIGELASTIDILSTRLFENEEERNNLDKLKKSFLTNISHELRTPIAVLRGSLELLKDGIIENPEEIIEYYEQMSTETHYLERLVNDLLDLSRLQDTSFNLNIEEVNLCDIIRDSERAIRKLAFTKSIEIQSICPEKESIIHGDYGRIRQLLLILLDNAIKFSKENNTVKIILSEKNKGYSLAISNFGEAIPDDILPHIFDRFYKAKEEKNRQGTGLGLVIAKEIAQRHNATISVNSSYKETVFEIIFKN